MSIFFLSLDQLKSYIISPEATLRSAMQMLNAGGELFVIVLDGDRVLRGVLTDGDVRRALLRGVQLDLPVLEAANASPLVVRSPERASVVRLLAERASRATFLPEVDERGCLIGIHLDRSIPQVPVALVMAGGEGRRLGERTKTTPKPLVVVRGRPMIEHVLDRLGEAGLSMAYISVHYLGEAMELWSSSWTGRIKIELVRESSPLGTAGAIGLLPVDIPNDVLVINADVATEVDFSGLLAFHNQFGADVTIATARHDVQVQFGVVTFDSSGRFQGIVEKPIQTHHIAAGIYVLGGRARALVERGRHLDMPELLERSRDAGLSIGVFPIHESWRDLGRPVDLEAEEAARRAEARIRK